MKEKEVYFVGSNGDEPEQIYFDMENAQADEPDYIDSFDTHGFRVNSYKRLESGNYTTEF